MTRYIIRRILQAIPLLFIISVMIFVLLRNSGDPIAVMGVNGPHAQKTESGSPGCWDWINPCISNTLPG